MNSHGRLCLLVAVGVVFGLGTELDADDDAGSVLTTVLQVHRPAETAEPWSSLSVDGADAFRGAKSVYFVVQAAPADGLVRFPRLNNQVRAAFVMPSDANSVHSHRNEPEHYQRATSVALTQTPTDWMLAVPGEATFPLVMALDLVEEPLYSPEPFRLAAGPDGAIVLPAHHAVVHGEKLQYEPLPHKNTVGYWVNPEDWAEWSFEAGAGEYDLLILQGCGEGQGGSFVEMKIDNLPIVFQAEDTGHFQNFRWRTLGRVSFDAARQHRLTLRAESIAQQAVMDVRQIRLVPVADVQTADRDVSTVAPDLVLPALYDAPPAAGTRVVRTLPEAASERVYHTIYLPTDWREGRTYPVIVDLAGNGPYENQLGDTCTGRVEDAQLGFGLSGGDGWIVLGLPYLNEAGTEPVTQWWGDAPDYDVSATLDYWTRAIDDVCEHLGGDRDCVVLAGFSRGAIACNYLGLHNDAIAEIWSGFVCFSHYDGIRDWPYPSDDRDAALSRLRRIDGRPQLILTETSSVAGANLVEIQNYLLATEISGRWTFFTTSFRNHSDAWAMRPSPARQRVRKWLDDIKNPN